MEKDLRELFEKDRLVNHKRKVDHEDLFIERLYKELPVERKSSFFKFNIAASVLLFIGLGVLSFIIINGLEKGKDLDGAIVNEFTLGGISPELKEIESFYVTHINEALEFVENDKGDRDMVNRYLKRLSFLKEEYKTLSMEMNMEGPNSQSISSLINNLKLQLELLQELREQLINIKNINHDNI